MIEFEYDHSIYSFEIFKLKHNIETNKTASGKYQFNVSVALEGRLSEDWNERENAFNEKYLQEIEGVVERRIEKNVKDFIGELQHEIKADICGFSQKRVLRIRRTFEKKRSIGMKFLVNRTFVTRQM